MAKHQKDYGVGETLLGTPDEFIKLLISDKKEQKTVLETIINDGPPHKQVYSALLLKTMFRLVKEIERHTGNKFVTGKGSLLTSEKDEIEIPIPFVADGIKKTELATIEEAVSHSPAHEIAAFNALLQGISWSIQTLKKEQREMSKN